MKRYWKKLLCCLLCLAMMTGCTEAGLQKNTAADENAAARQTAVTYKSASPVSSEPEGKEETVYILTDASGAVKNVIVTDRLGNPNGGETVSDVSELSDIENMEGDETFTQKGTELTWNAGGKAITYRGVTDKMPPVTMKVRYFLDGTELSPEEIAGKSGHVTIRYEFTNNEAKVVELDNGEETLYVPFAVLTGLMLDGEHFSNVSVSTATSCCCGC